MALEGRARLRSALAAQKREARSSSQGRELLRAGERLNNVSDTDRVRWDSEPARARARTRRTSDRQLARSDAGCRYLALSTQRTRTIEGPGLVARGHWPLVTVDTARCSWSPATGSWRLATCATDDLVDDRLAPGFDSSVPRWEPTWAVGLAPWHGSPPQGALALPFSRTAHGARLRLICRRFLPTRRVSTSARRLCTHSC